MVCGLSCLVYCAEEYPGPLPTVQWYPATHSRVDQNCLQTSPNVPWGAEPPQMTASALSAHVSRLSPLTRILAALEVESCVLPEGHHTCCPPLPGTHLPQCASHHPLDFSLSFTSKEAFPALLSSLDGPACVTPASCISYLIMLFPQFYQD